MRTTKPMTTNERVMHTFQDDFQKAIEKMDELHALCNEDARIASQHDDDFQKAIEKMEQLHALCNEDAHIASHPRRSRTRSAMDEPSLRESSVREVAVRFIDSEETHAT